MENNNQTPKISAYDLNSVAKNLSNATPKTVTIIKGSSPYNTGNVIVGKANIKRGK